MARSSSQSAPRSRGRPNPSQSPPRAALTVVVTDARTGEPLPLYALSALPGPEGENDTTETTLTTDARGEAKIPSEFLTMPFTLRALDDEQRPVKSPLVRRPTSTASART